MGEITEQEIQKYLTGSFGRELVLYDEIDSTNNAAKLLAKNGAPHGAAVIARRQTAGKGRLGRRFYSPAGSGIYLTAILRPEASVEQSILITSAAAVATARAIEEVSGVQVRIKWVNDLYLDGKKLCGILAESALRPDGGLAYLVVGIGVNVTSSAFPPEVADVATSLSAGTGRSIDRNRLIASVLNHLEAVYGQLASREFMKEYRERSCVIGREVRMIQGEHAEQATVLDIDEDARLIVRTADGIKTVSTGEVSLRGDFR
ncbi:biotin--[acetyl-CoA-carboxylase] ligase [Anaerotruncus rubiinfantis]|uniref:biotin--[acetyl-CoA-carboxylase] ligase n=1 Tax=Anaerotruncus rubiinfantis TaxID=1720200 RepID=UPI00189794A8|nr:biotin--[acetyl-CoA-carboxylase] ligase [Anaerotruncus rubiinfantis]